LPTGTPARPARKRSYLILASLVLGGISTLAVPLAMLIPPIRIYVSLLLPFGLVGAALAFIAMQQIKRGSRRIQDRGLALLAYFLGLAPLLYFCGEVTYEVLSLQ
jgi:hypothetical protein